MNNNFIAKASITIHVPAAKVWEALTTPDVIKKFLFGTEVVSDWKVGSKLIYRGIWNGKKYEDKGEILKMVPNKLLQSTFLSESSGLPDEPENYAVVTYELNEEDGHTTISVSQDRCQSEKACEDSQKNWEMVLKSMKELLEKAN